MVLSNRRGPDESQPSRISPPNRTPLSAEERRFKPIALRVLREVARPKRRADCIGNGFNSVRPCHFVACSMHLRFDLTSDGKIIDQFPERPIEDMPATCVLDAAESERTFAEVGVMLNVTEERVRQVYHQAIKTPGIRQHFENVVDPEDLEDRKPVPRRIQL